jgi:hypothetical protein
MSGTAPYYTQAFSPLPGRCSRVVAGGEGGGSTHSPDPPVWRAPFRAPKGRRDWVEGARATGLGGHRPTLSRGLPGRLSGVSDHAGGAVRSSP